LTGTQIVESSIHDLRSNGVLRSSLHADDVPK
jgi:hypothetical protein